jgi:hypothetical protein
MDKFTGRHFLQVNTLSLKIEARQSLRKRFLVLIKYV